MGDRKLDDVHNTLQGIISALGRDDIGVGDVTQQDGMISFTLTKGRFIQSGEIPAVVLADRQQAMVHLNAILRTLSKKIESEHIEHAAQAAGKTAE